MTRIYGAFLCLIDCIRFSDNFFHWSCSNKFAIENENNAVSINITLYLINKSSVFDKKSFRNLISDEEEMNKNRWANNRKPRSEIWNMNKVCLSIYLRKSLWLHYDLRNMFVLQTSKQSRSLHHLVYMTIWIFNVNIGGYLCVCVCDHVCRCVWLFICICVLLVCVRVCVTTKGRITNKAEYRRDMCYTNKTHVRFASVLRLGKPGISLRDSFKFSA